MTRWKIKERKVSGPYLNYLKEFYDNLGINDIYSDILINRNVDPNDIEKLLKKPETLLEEPEDLYGCKQVSDKIIKFLKSGRKFHIFADYDVDGLTSGYIMKTYLERLGADVRVYFPERKEGYGISMKFIKKIPEDTVVITVDNGSTAFDVLEYCLENNIDILVTDHHNLSTEQKFPKKIPICNPHADENGPGHHLCGAAVAWKICTRIDKKLKKDFAKDLITFAAIGTISDIMPMTIENQAIVLIGLKDIEENAPNIFKLGKAFKLNEIDFKTISWNIAPELNACGRMGRIEPAVQLMFEDTNSGRLKDIILEVYKLNEKRKDITAKAVSKALEKNDPTSPICIFDASLYPIGLAGVIANKLMNSFNKPTIIYNKSGDCYTGSVRSPYDILDILEVVKEKGSVISYGGHSKACGISINNIDKFKKDMTEAIYSIALSNKELNKVFEQELLIDHEIVFNDLNTSLYNSLMKIPTDKDYFKEPLFCIKNLSVTEVKHSKNNYNNICFSLVDSEKVLKEIWAWNMSDEYEALGSPKYIDIAGTIKKQGFGKYPDKIVINVDYIRKSPEISNVRAY